MDGGISSKCEPDRDQLIVNQVVVYLETPWYLPTESQKSNWDWERDESRRVDRCIWAY